jgi:hypothetical protein
MLQKNLIQDLIDIFYSYIEINDYERLLKIVPSEKYFNLNRYLHLYFDCLFSNMRICIESSISHFQRGQFQGKNSAQSKILTELRKTYLNRCIDLLKEYKIAEFSKINIFRENDTAADIMNITVASQSSVENDDSLEYYNVYIVEENMKKYLVYYNNFTKTIEFKCNYMYLPFPLREFFDIYIYRFNDLYKNYTQTSFTYGQYSINLWTNPLNLIVENISTTEDDSD